MTETYEVTRKHPRFQVKVRVKYKTEKDKTSEGKWVETRDLSEGGIGLDMMSPPYVGEVVFLEIFFGESTEDQFNENKVDTKAEVVWRREAVGCGVRFFKLTAKEKDLLSKFILAQTTDPGL